MQQVYTLLICLWGSKELMVTSMIKFKQIDKLPLLYL